MCHGFINCGSLRSVVGLDLFIGSVLIKGYKPRTSIFKSGTEALMGRFDLILDTVNVFVLVKRDGYLHMGSIILSQDVLLLLFTLL